MVDAVQRSQMPGANDPPAPGLRREMRGPGMDFGSLMNMMGPPPGISSRPPRPDDDDVSDIVSVDAGGDSREVNVKSSRGRKTKKKEVSI